MAEIVGTITNLSDFLSKTQVCLSVKPNDPQQQIICLEADRKYSIPAFQREVRWDDNNLKMLLYDLSRSSKFLGNIILTIKSDHTCEIIDGQQRTTVLMLIVSCIKKKFGTKISTPDLCPLRNEGFTGFQTLLEKAFDQEAITSDDWNAILKSDDYLQLPRIQKLWNTISSSELLADRHKAQGLLDNLCKSEFNIIASYSNDVNTSIQYFLDVNLKGIRLDTEDIFKGYLFSQDSRELTRSLWQKNKRDVLRLNGVTQSSEEKRYPLMKLYEHFFYCDLYLPREGDCEYSTLKFGENFCLTSGFESGSTKYYEGSHLIEAIRDRDYLQNVLSRLNKCVEIMTDIIESEGPSTPFKDKFICAKKVDSIDIQNCHSMLKKILMEKEVIPKILALKYILTYFDGKPHAKEEYKSVYSVFCAAVLFTVFANKKESDTFYNFVRLEEWKSKINKWLYDYISSHALTRGKVLAAYKYSESDRSTYSLIPDADKGQDWFWNFGDGLPVGYEENKDRDLSKYAQYKYYNHDINAGLNIIREKYRLNFGVSLQPQNTRLDYKKAEVDTVVKRNVFNFAPNVDFRYRFSKVSQLRFTYRGRASQPSMENLLDVTDDSNPLNIRKGNPGLKPSFSHSMRLFYNTYNADKQRGMMAHANLNMTQNSITNATTYNQSTGGVTVKPENINGNWNAMGMFGFNTALRDKRFTINSFSRANYTNAVSYLFNDDTKINDKNTSTTLTFGENLNGTFRNDWFEFTLNGSINYNFERNQLRPENNQEPYTFGYGASTNISLPWSMTLSTNITNNARRGYRDASMNKNELIWNAQIAQNFLKGNAATISFEVYDILRQQSNISRSLTADMRSVSEYNGINSYCMLRFSYRLNVFGNKEARGNMRHGGFDGGGPRGPRGGFGGGRPH